MIDFVFITLFLTFVKRVRSISFTKKGMKISFK